MNTLAENPTLSLALPPVETKEAPEALSNPVPVDAELETLKQSSDWLLSVRPVDGAPRHLRRDECESVLRDGLVQGTLDGDTGLEIHAKTEAGKWLQSSSTLAVFARERFALRVLFEPVWSHALGGLRWGALAGIVLKLLDTVILLASANPAMAFFFLVAIVICMIPRIGFLGVLAISVYGAQAGLPNFFIMAFASGLTGALLGCLPGMAAGGLIGYCRRSSLPRAARASSEGATLPWSAVILPLAGAVALWGFYVFVFNPWLVTVLESGQ